MPPLDDCQTRARRQAIRMSLPYGVAASPAPKRLLGRLRAKCEQRGGDLLDDVVHLVVHRMERRRIVFAAPFDREGDHLAQGVIDEMTAEGVIVRCSGGGIKV